jgi:hypothetical protein
MRRVSVRFLMYRENHAEQAWNIYPCIIKQFMLVALSGLFGFLFAYQQH